ncbi:hypothetical protein [Bradyrhizobium erythrophlei]|uniref:Uncharacterized protein n=1 Tax=Bradyrhizobium erythrophlei TaxID=1437360 RepID=A0A1M5LHW1_9BRAD|nr:hypothetical protein [Bradyrhizobium erythrophlei]SHG64269.1 hypothetical protein SAMN05444169_3460 [Bradyrhizobium erythrophlei]
MSPDEEILLYFKIAGPGIDAQTFANALLAFDELYRAINASANPGREIEVEFISSDQGSIRTIIRIFQKDTQTLLHAPVTLLILPILIAVVVTKLMSDTVTIVVDENSYVVEYGSEKIILPKDAAKTVERVDHDAAVRRTVRKFFSIVESDSNVTAVDFRRPIAPNQPVMPIEKNQFATLRDLPEVELPALPKKREEYHSRAPVVVLTAVLEKSKRKWQFLWRGQKISADIRDDSFFEKLANHEYEFGQGDTLTVDLVAEQEINDFVGAYETKTFYITKVHKHSRGPKQQTLF